MSDFTRNASLLVRTARDLDVTLPDPVTAALAFDLNLPPIVQVREATAHTIASAFGTDDYVDVQAEALADLAAAEAGSTLRAGLEARLGAFRWRVVQEHANAIVGTFRAALDDDLQALSTYAPKVPHTYNPRAPRDGMHPETFRAVFEATRAAERLDKALVGLAAVYGLPAIGSYPARASRRAALLVLPERLDDDAAKAVLLGLADRREILTGLREQTATSAAWFAVSAHHGARFDLASPAAARANVRRLAEALIPQPEATPSGRVTVLG